MLKIKDKANKTKFILRDEDEEPVEVKEKEVSIKDEKEEKDDKENN